jgi:hypothetical protein
MRKKPLPTDLLYRSVRGDSEPRHERVQKIFRKRLVDMDKTYDGEVLVGQRWVLMVHPELGTWWDVTSVSDNGTVVLRGVPDLLGHDYSKVTWIIGVEELTRLGHLRQPGERVINDTSGPGVTTEEGAVG